MRYTTTILIALATACGATADPLPPADGGSDARPIGAHGCRLGEARLGDSCVPTDDDNCGATGRACGPREECGVVADGRTLSVRCMPL